MPSYVITGVSRGIGYAFMQNLARDPSNIIIGLVRDKAGTDKKVAADEALQKNKNIHIFEADVTNVDALKKAAEKTAKITGGGLDVLINNAAYFAPDAFVAAKAAENDLQTFNNSIIKSVEANVIGPLNVFVAFLPLLRQGKTKKVVNVTTGLADNDLTNNYGIENAAPYTISKAGLNKLTAKLNVSYKDEGILVLAISPGFVSTQDVSQMPEEMVSAFMGMAKALQKYQPNFTAPVSPEESVEMTLKVLDDASLEKGDGGKFLSHFGNTQWL